MANHMDTTLTIVNLDKQSFDKLKEIFNDGINEYYCNVEHVIKQMYGEVDYTSLDWWYSNIGSKWVEIETSITGDFEESIEIYMTSAWNVPTIFLEKLRDILVYINKDVILYGTYQDESLDPIGAFVYALDYDDIEDLDIEVDSDKYWSGENDDEYRYEIYDEMKSFSDYLLGSYNEVKAERENEDSIS
jgi:hypothetical protein